MYLLGVSAREKKTHCVVGDEKGNVYAEGFGGPSNYQISGVEMAKHSIEIAVGRALSKLNLSISDMRYCILGLEGAYYDEDFEMLQEVGAEIFGEVPFEIVSDSCIELRVGCEMGWGVVSACGSRYNTMGQAPNGRKAEFRDMGYELGKFARGNDLVIRRALNYSFLGAEGIGVTTKLQKEIPRLFELESMAEVGHRMRMTGTTGSQIDRIPQLVVELAKSGDEIAQQILIEIGSDLGKMAAGVIKKLGLQKEKVPIIMVGGLFVADNPLMMDSYRLEVHKAAPLAIFKLLDKKPVLGAYYLALDHVK